MSEAVARRPEWCIVSCESCDAFLRSPFPPRPEAHDPDGLDAFAIELATELGLDEYDITTDVARAWSRAFGWVETGDGWCCPLHRVEASP